MNTQNQLTKTDGPAGSLALDTRSDPLPIHLPDALPCPFCGSTRIVKGERFFAICVDCGATGPERNSDATVRKFTGDWNTRHVLPNIKMTDADLPDVRTPDGRT